MFQYFRRSSIFAAACAFVMAALVWAPPIASAMAACAVACWAAICKFPAAIKERFASAFAKPQHLAAPRTALTSSVAYAARQMRHDRPQFAPQSWRMCPSI